MICDNCGESGAKIRKLTRSYGKGKKLLVIEVIKSFNPELSINKVIQIQLNGQTISHQLDKEVKLRTGTNFNLLLS